MHYLLRSVTSASDLLLYTETCRQWGHLLRDAVQAHLLVHNATEKDSHQTPGYHHATIFALSRHILDMSDGLSLLIDQGSGGAGHPILRSLFEAQIALSYIAKDDTINRALAFQVAHMHHRQRTSRLVDPQTPEGAEFSEEVKEDPVWSSFQNVPWDSARVIDELTELLKKPEFAPIEAEWQRVRTQKKQDPQWYWMFNGPLSIRALARESGHIGSYRLLYSLWVGSLQAGDVMANFTRNSEGRAVLRPLRFPMDLQNGTIMAISALLGAAEDLMKIYNQNPTIRETFTQKVRETVEEKYAALIKYPQILNITY
jgi:hypothetical protein